MAKINLSNLPNAPGVYLFKDKKRRIIYIGKSANLKARIGSYFKSGEIYSPLKKALLENIAEIDYKIAPSEIEALILESQLIKKHQPKYNILLKDNSRFFYIALTKENFPRLLITHQPDKIKNIGSVLGPFTGGTSLKTALKILRKIFPFRTCKNPANKPCLYYELGLCPAHFADKKSYAKNLKNLFLILRGKKTDLIKVLKKEMGLFSKKQLYEEAERVKQKFLYLQNVFNHEKVIKEEFARTEPDWQKTEKALGLLFPPKTEKANKKINRIEGYDVSSIGEKMAVGAMSVFVNGKPAKSEYRKFKIKTAGLKDDISRLKEIIERRLKRKEWNYPDLILIDGGKAQLNMLLRILEFFKLGNKIIAVALAKKEEELYLADGRVLNLRKKADLYPLLANLRNEAHRFAKDFLAAKHQPLF